MSSLQQTLRGILTNQARRYEKKVFLECGSRSYSFRDVDYRTDRVASGLARQGIRPGDRVALLLSGGPELVFFFLGAAKMGTVTVPLHPGEPDDSILWALRASGPKALVTDAGNMRQARRLWDSGVNIPFWIMADELPGAEGPFLGWTGEPLLGFWPGLHPDDTATIAFTRGTRGSVKPVELSHRNLVSSARQVLRPFRVDETDRFYTTFPLTTVPAQVLQLLAPWEAGAACVLSTAESAGGVAGELAEERVTVVTGPPEFFARMAESAEAGRRDLSPLRLGVSYSGPLSRQVLEGFESITDAFLVESYGLLEATCVVCANPYTGVRKAGSVGLPLPGLECRVVDEHGRDRPRGEPGEIVVRGPNVMKGYYGRREETQSAVHSGWLHTGDRGFINGDGYYHLLEREV